MACEFHNRVVISAEVLMALETSHFPVFSGHIRFRTGVELSERRFSLDSRGHRKVQL